MKITITCVVVALFIGCASGREADPSGDPSPDDPPVDPPVDDPPEDDPPDDDAPPAGVGRQIEIYSGDGTMVMQGWPGGDALKAIVLDDGVPAPGVTVTWATTSGNMAMTGGFATGLTGTSVTDANGIARVGLRGAFESQMDSSKPSIIRASIGEGSVEFRTHSTYYLPQIPAMPQTYIVEPVERDFGVFPPNTILPAALSAQVVFQAGSDQGKGMPGVGMRFMVNSNDATIDHVPALACANASSGTRSGGTVITDAMGIATCDVRLPSAPGTYTVGVFVGGATVHSPFLVRVQ